MKAIVWTAYGPPEVLQLQELEKPVPEENEILIRVRAATVTAGDCEMRGLKFPPYLRLPMRMFTGFRRPTRVKIIGQELAGEVEAIGEGVTQYKVGDRVFGSAGLGAGTYAEYICLPEVPGEMDGALAVKPANVTFEEAAAVPLGGLEALHFLRQAHIQPGHRVLINGAGGSIGTFGVQLAKYYGAEVTAVDSAEKLEMLDSLGADHVVDYIREDFTRSGQMYDVIFDVVGASPYARSLRSLSKDGSYLIANPRLSLVPRGWWTSRTSTKRVFLTTSSPNKEDLLFLKELVETKVIKAVIDRIYPLEETVDAHRYVESGVKKGNVVITV
jgi:NADPH:quinone reductase-like Zn-dependent oxidoreductase